LAEYGRPPATLSDLVYYGWFGVVARPMLLVLHFFYSLVANYGVAIIMLTVLVRGCMFPLSRKQALGAQKMQELQPEMRRITEKFKNDPEKRTRATQELFRQHNYNPLGGCLLVFVQTPIFIGLYRSLMVDVELRQAPLITESIRWASNLAAPDMLWNWSGVMPAFITSGTGILGLGPYFNILPILTIGLFIWQQKMFMPPPADEQARLQQKMMQYMMIFMGVLFFKVASGLCVYFIASSLWGLCERKLLPKAGPKGGAPAGGAVPAKAAAPTGNGAPGSKKRERDRK
jgi:YidC/Oxa1 family membrane protein insertase